MRGFILYDYRKHIIATMGWYAHLMMRLSCKITVRQAGSDRDLTQVIPTTHGGVSL